MRDVRIGIPATKMALTCELAAMVDLDQEGLYAQIEARYPAWRLSPGPVQETVGDALALRALIQKMIVRLLRAAVPRAKRKRRRAR